MREAAVTFSQMLFQYFATTFWKSAKDLYQAQEAIG
jgi:hypothetical protein